jgi:hypothetical protein
MKLTKELLSLILMVQAYKKLMIHQSIFYGYFKQQTTDWYRETQKYYHLLDTGLLHQVGLKKNLHDFEKVISYDVTDEIMDTDEDLDNYEF